MGQVETPSSAKTALEYFAIDWAFSIYCVWATVASMYSVAFSLVGSSFFDCRVHHQLSGAHASSFWAVAIISIAATNFLVALGLRWILVFGVGFG